MKNILFAQFLILISFLSLAQNSNLINVNQLITENEDKAGLFGDELISTGLNEFNATFAPDMSAFYFSVRHRGDYFAIMQCQVVNGIMQQVEIADFSGQFNDADPFISSDGNTLYFCSDRYSDKTDTLRDWNIWSMEWNEGGWTNLTLLPFNTAEKNEMYPTVAKNGNVYFHSDYASKSKVLDFNGTDIYVAELSNGEYSGFKKIEPVSLIDLPEWDPFISPDEDYLIFTSPRKDSFGGGDLYISYRQNNGSWSEPKNMGNKVNSVGMDYCPNLSPDGKVLFFSSYRNEIDFSSRPGNYGELVKKVNSSRNGNGDIYFISSKVINELR